MRLIVVCVVIALAAVDTFFFVGLGQRAAKFVVHVFFLLLMFFYFCGGGGWPLCAFSDVVSGEFVVAGCWSNHWRVAVQDQLLTGCCYGNAPTLVIFSTCSDLGQGLLQL